MYLRPEIYKEFVIEDNKADISKTGRPQLRFLVTEPDAKGNTCGSNTETKG